MQNSLKIAVLSASFGLASISSAALVTVDAATLTGPTSGGLFTGDTTIDDVTIGGTTFPVLTATGAATTGAATWSFVGTDPLSLSAAVTGPRVDTGANNIATADLTFARNIADGEQIFIIDFTTVGGSFDDVTVQATSGGTPIGTPFVIPVGAAPALGTLESPSRESDTIPNQSDLPNLDLVGFALSLSDLGVTAGDNVDGVLLSDSGTSFDLTAAGIAVVPEPTSAGVIALGGLLLLARRARD
ncbi:MAG: hypothetical protein AAF916_13080 [Planctomycetota bacterium]